MSASLKFHCKFVADFGLCQQAVGGTYQGVIIDQLVHLHIDIYLIILLLLHVWLHSTSADITSVSYSADEALADMNVCLRACVCVIGTTVLGGSCLC